MVLTVSLILSGIATALSTIVSTAVDFFKMLPAFVQFLFISGVLFLDSQNEAVIGNSINSITEQWIGIQVNSFILFAITFIIGLITLTYSANKYLSNS